MMLSGEDIRRAIEVGDLELSPYSEQCIRPSGLLLHLGYDLLKPLPGNIVDVTSGALPEYDKITLEERKPYTLEPGEFLLGSTLQSVTVGPAYGLLIEGRSTLARVGLTIVQTAMLVYPGHKKRPITLELANHGPNAIQLYPRMKIARAALFELKTPTEHCYDEQGGKYRNQTTVGAPIFQNELLLPEE